MGVHVEAEDSAELVGIYTCSIYGKVLPALLSCAAQRSATRYRICSRKPLELIKGSGKPYCYFEVCNYGCATMASPKRSKRFA